jgi:hypothetical protein
MDSQYLQNEGISKNLIKGVIPIAGTYDILHYYQVLAKANGNSFADNHVLNDINSMFRRFVNS